MHICFFMNIAPSKIVQVITLVAFVRDVYGSNLARDTVLARFPQSIHENF
jgi:hypothetical protein